MGEENGRKISDKKEGYWKNKRREGEREKEEKDGV